MPQIRFNKNTYPLIEGQSVLEALEQGGCDIPHSCRAGACQACMMQRVEGELPPQSQQGLMDTLKAQNYFLACQCRPSSDLTVALPQADDLRTACVVVDHEPLCHDVVRLRLEAETKISYRPGQYITLWKESTLGRSYSLASVPQVDRERLEIHVKRVPEGRMSRWLYDEAKLGTRLQLQGPIGNCFYVDSDKEQALLLAATGTGLAPLYGIVRDALLQGHTGEIHVVHGALTVEGLYLHRQLKHLASEYDNLFYHPCVLNADCSGNLGNEISPLPIDELIKTRFNKLDKWRAYLCGPASTMQPLRKKVFLNGVAMNQIHSDLFTG